jgi:hypothetical protein
MQPIRQIARIGTFLSADGPTSVFGAGIEKPVDVVSFPGTQRSRGWSRAAWIGLLLMSPLVGRMPSAQAQSLKDVMEKYDVVCLAEVGKKASENPIVIMQGGRRIVVRRNASNVSVNVIRVAKDSPFSPSFDDDDIVPRGLAPAEVFRVSRTPHSIYPLDDVEVRGMIGSEGELVLLLGNRASDSQPIRWTIRPINEDQFEYATEIPPQRDAAARAAYLARFLNSSNDGIADDALGALNQLDLRALRACRRLFARSQLQAALRDPHKSEPSRALASRLLGLIGAPEDAALFEPYLLQSRMDVEIRNPVAELAIGYLLLTGEKGLDKLDVWTLRNPKADPSDLLSILDALWIVVDETPETISRDRLLRSVRPLLDRPIPMQAAVLLLAHCCDWSVHEQLMTLYRQRSTLSLTKRAIIRYVLGASHVRPTTASSVSDSLRTGWSIAALKELRSRDPELVRFVEQSFEVKIPR